MPVIDFHVHTYDFPVQGPPAFIEFMNRELGSSFEEFVRTRCNAASYVKAIDEAGIDYAVILAELAPLTSAIASNEGVRRLCDENPRLLPFANINPSLTGQLDRELERLVVKEGFRGVKLYPTYQFFYPNDARIYPLYAKAQELGVPVLLHTGSSVFPASRIKYGDPIYLDDVAVDFPELNIVLAHSGRPFWFDRAYALARFRPHIYMELSGLPPSRLMRYFPELERVADKAIFGSDWPSVPTLKENVAAIRNLPISEEAKTKILGGTAARLLKLA